MKELLFNHVATRGQLEQANIADGMAWLKKQKSPDILTERLVRDLHKRLFGQVWKWAESCLKTENNIGIDSLQIVIELRHLLDDACYWIEHQTYLPMELAARFHHKLLLIHPFPNRNGRHLRIIADAMLTKLMGEPAIDWAGGYKLKNMNERRDQYIAALRATDKHDFSKLLEFVGA